MESRNRACSSQRSANSARRAFGIEELVLVAVGVPVVLLGAGGWFAGAPHGLVHAVPVDMPVRFLSASW